MRQSKKKKPKVNAPQETSSVGADSDNVLEEPGGDFSESDEVDEARIEAYYQAKPSTRVWKPSLPIVAHAVMPASVSLKLPTLSAASGRWESAPSTETAKEITSSSRKRKTMIEVENTDADFDEGEPDGSDDLISELEMSSEDDGTEISVEKDIFSDDDRNEEDYGEHSEVKIAKPEKRKKDGAPKLGFRAYLWQ